MYAVELLKIDISVKDRFGYTALDYSLSYQKPYCMIYLFYKCKCQKISEELISKIVTSLCEGPAPTGRQRGYDPAKLLV